MHARLQPHAKCIWLSPKLAQSGNTTSMLTGKMAVSTFDFPKRKQKPHPGKQICGFCHTM